MRPLVLLAMIQTGLLLAASYFVLLTIDKAGKNLKTYGKVVAAILIIVAVLVCLKGITVMISGEYPSLIKMCSPMMR